MLLYIFLFRFFSITDIKLVIENQFYLINKYVHTQLIITIFGQRDKNINKFCLFKIESLSLLDWL